MIHNLQGIHETVDYKADTQICLYYNDEAENYPPHWHPSFEVIMPVINDYWVVCGHTIIISKKEKFLLYVPVCSTSSLLRQQEKGLFFSPT